MRNINKNILFAVLGTLFILASCHNPFFPGKNGTGDGPSYRDPSHYAVVVQAHNDAAGDTVSWTPAEGANGTSVAISYSLANTAAYNQLEFAGVRTALSPVKNSGDGDLTYIINADDADDNGVITIAAVFYHGATPPPDDSPVYSVLVDTGGRKPGDSAAAVPFWGRAGETVAVNYTLANFMTHNKLDFAGAGSGLASVEEAGSGTRSYVIKPEDADADNVILIKASFVHASDPDAPELAEYDLAVKMSDEETGDSASVSPTKGRTGRGAVITYTVANTNTYNYLDFSGVGEELDPVGEPGSGRRLYTVDGADALEGKITIYAAFTHSGTEPSPLYRIQINRTGNMGNDYAVAGPSAGRIGNTVTVFYRVANAANFNCLDFGGVGAGLESVDEAGTGTREYAIDPEDASGNVITITAAFIHMASAPPTYTVNLHESGKEGGDAITRTPTSGRAGRGVTLSYTLADTRVYNLIDFSGASAGITAVASAGSGRRLYTINALDAVDGAININAAFTHSDTQVSALYQIRITMTGNGAGDSVSASPSEARVGNTVTINYALANSATNNKIDFTGVGAHLASVETAGSGEREYTVNADDVINNSEIIINARFIHENDGGAEILDEYTVTLGVYYKAGSDDIAMLPAAGKGRAGSAITINYTVDNTSTYNMLEFAGTATPIPSVTAAGSGTRTYIINKNDADGEGNISIAALFYHNASPPASPLYAVVVEMIDNEPGDSVTVTPPYGHSGETVTLGYTLVGGSTTNQLEFEGLTSAIAAVTAAGTGNRQFVLNTLDASDGVIRLVAVFTHTGGIIDPLTFTDSSVTINKTYGDAAFNNAIIQKTNAGGYNGTGALSYSVIPADSNVAEVDANGRVTIKNAGTVTVRASKAADGVYAAANKTYELRVAQRPLTVTQGATPELSPIDTTATFSVSNIIGTDTLTLGMATNARGLSLTAGNTNIGIAGSTVTVTYNGTETVTTTDAVPTALVLSGNANYTLGGSGTISTRIYDGQVEPRAIPVRTANIVRANGFNDYAATTLGLTRHYKVVENITLAPDIASNPGTTNWTVIAGSFAGTLNGQNYTVSGMTNVAAGNRAMFNAIGAGAAVKNLKLTNIYFHTLSTANNSFGGIALTNNGTIDNCAVQGGRLYNRQNATSANYYGLSGGIVNTNSASGVIKNCTFGGDEGSIMGGGIAYTNYGIIEYCYFFGRIIGSGNFEIGGIAANNMTGTIRYCYSTGDITIALNPKDSLGKYFVGGIAGKNDSSTVPYPMSKNIPSTIHDCYVTGNVSCDAAFGNYVPHVAGGIAGFTAGDTANLTQVQSRGIITRCYYAGAGVFMPSFAGGITGWTTSSAQVEKNVLVRGGIRRQNGGDLSFRMICINDRESSWVRDNTFGCAGAIVPYYYIRTSYGIEYRLIFYQDINGIADDYTGHVNRCLQVLGSATDNYYFRFTTNDENITSPNPKKNITAGGSPIGDAQVHSAAWWRSTIGLSDDYWDLADGRLPHLRNMPGNPVQNPSAY
jgi:hypothetical protein